MSSYQIQRSTVECQRLIQALWFVWKFFCSFTFALHVLVFDSAFLLSFFSCRQISIFPLKRIYVTFFVALLRSKCLLAHSYSVACCVFVLRNDDCNWMSEPTESVLGCALIFALLQCFDFVHSTHSLVCVCFLHVILERTCAFTSYKYGRKSALSFIYINLFVVVSDF